MIVERDDHRRLLHADLQRLQRVRHFGYSLLKQQVHILTHFSRSVFRTFRATFVGHNVRIFLILIFVSDFSENVVVIVSEGSETVSDLPSLFNDRLLIVVNCN